MGSRRNRETQDLTGVVGRLDHRLTRGNATNVCHCLLLANAFLIARCDPRIALKELDRSTRENLGFSGRRAVTQSPFRSHPQPPQSVSK